MPSVRSVAVATERRRALSGSAKCARSFGGLISSRIGSVGVQLRILGLKFWRVRRSCWRGCWRRAYRVEDGWFPRIGGDVLVGFESRHGHYKQHEPLRKDSTKCGHAGAACLFQFIYHPVHPGSLRAQRSLSKPYEHDIGRDLPYLPSIKSDIRVVWRKTTLP